MVAVIIVAFGRNAVERIAARTAAAPVRSGLIGLLAEILFVPVLVLTAVVLAVSIIGIPLLFLLPFAVLLVMLVALVGFVGLAYHVGRWIASRFGWREPGAYGSVAIGVVAIGGLTLLAKLAALGGGFVIGAPLTGLGYFVELWRGRSALARRFSTGTSPRRALVTTGRRRRHRARQSSDAYVVSGFSRTRR
jgi:hypothetical protein